MLALGAVGIFGPPGASLALLVLPLPALVAGGVGGAAQAAAAMVGTAGLFRGMLGGSVAVGVLATAGVPAVMAVLLLRRACRLELVVGAAVGCSLFCAFAFAAWHGAGPFVWRDALHRHWQSGFDASLQVYRDLGISAESLADLDVAREDLSAQLEIVFPSLLLLATAAFWIVNLGLSRRWAGWPQLESLSRWRSADWMIWVLIASGFGLFLPRPAVGSAAINVFILSLACYFAQGLAIVSFFLQRVGLPRPLRLATFFVIAFQSLATMLVVMVGVFDLWGDFRNLYARSADATAGPDSDV